MKLADLLDDVERTRKIGNPFASGLEGYAALLADGDELWEDVKANSDILAMAQAERVVGTAVRFLVDLFEIPAAIALGDMLAELDRARKKFPAFNSAHEGYAVLLEELDELWTEIKGENPFDNPLPSAGQAARRKAIGEEAIQVGAMALRMLTDCWGVELEIGNGGKGADR